MEMYRNLSGNSGVLAYEIGSDHILIKFSGNYRIYSYNYRKAGQNYVETMKGFAQSGSGLNSYINRYVKKLSD